MDHEVAQILKLLAFSPDSGIWRQRCNQIFRMSSRELLAFLLFLEEHLQQPSVQSVRDCAYCHLLAGAIALEEHRPRVALSHLRQSVASFRRQNDLYNEALALWLSGLACAREQQTAEAQQFYQTARERIQTWASLEDKREEKAYCTILQGIDNSLSSLQSPWQAPTSSPAPTLPASSDFLSLPSFPLFARVQAGPDGPIWGENQSGEMVIDVETFYVGASCYIVFSTHGGDHRVPLQRTKSYGWVTVHGDSMHAAKPVPIVDGDLALFYQADDAVENEIVVVSWPDDGGSGYQYMIKRWKASRNEFVSESTSRGYSPVPRDSKHRILGIVVAVAKRVSA